MRKNVTYTQASDIWISLGLERVVGATVVTSGLHSYCVSVKVKSVRLPWAF